MSISEEQLSNWTNPPSDTEDERAENAIAMVKDAINSDDKLKYLDLDIFCQGSYANNTNVRLDSDVDVNVLYNGTYYWELPPNTTKEMFPSLMKDSPASYSFWNLKNDVEKALRNKFGSVIRKNKCLHISENSYHTEIDVVPTCQHRWYRSDGSYAEGVALFTDVENKKVVNYPKQHIANGIQKNLDTSKRFKKLVRIFKKTRYDMQDNRVQINANISSFLLECLVWNCPNSIFERASWRERFQGVISHIWENTKTHELCKEWGEVSELLYLFHHERKWTYADVNECMLQMFNYVFRG